ncbi:MAG TPA: helix-turn-helix transcriptional regulator [Methylotenera sp.]|nr:helix-turn-helix transcriptional regulator [Methylotenera sp.]
MKDQDLSLQKKLGANISARRRSLGWTQEFLAHQLEVDTETISRIERGVTCPSLKTLAKIAHLLTITIAELLDEDPPAEPVHVEVIAKLIEPLQENDRSLILQTIRTWAHHFANMRND